MRILRLIAVAVAVACGTAILPAPATAASGPVAAAYTCNGGSWEFDGIKGFYIFLPIYAPALEIDCLLRRGNYDNWGVVALQNMLIKCYGQGIARDGDFGPGTEAALRNAQRWERDVNRKNLAVDGVYGPDTRHSVMWPYSKTSDIDGGFTCRY